MSHHRIPTFIGLGVAKTGSTSLKAYLNQHPEIFIPELREPSYFAFDDSKRFLKGVGTLEEYLAIFEGAGSQKHIGEISPAYFESSEACRHIKELIPDARIIVCVRQPVERSYSHYLMRLRSYAVSDDGFEDAVRDYAGRESVEEELGSWFYISSFYHDRIKQYYDAFGRSNVHVFKYDDYGNDPQKTLKGIFRFLDVDPEFNVDHSVKERIGRGAPRSRALKSVVGSTGLAKRFFKMIVPDATRERLRLLVYRLNHKPKEGLSPDVKKPGRQ